MQKIISILVKVVALAGAAYHMAYVLYPVQNPILHINTHLMFAIVLVYLALAEKSKQGWPTLLLCFLALLGLGGTLYVQILYPELILRTMFNTTLDLAIGVMLIALCIDACRRTMGWLIPALAIGVVLYPFLGQYLPEPFYTTSYSVKRVISNLSLIFNNGLYSNALYSSAEYIFLFMIFGGVVEATGVANFFIELGKMIGRRFKGGGAIMSVVSSAGVGAVTTSVIANMSITGAFTIPLMKSIGYKPHEAGAIECASSNGGQILPPVMGVLAFFVAGLAGIPYIKLCAMGLITGALYYLNVGTYAYLLGGKRGIGKMDVKIDWKQFWLTAPPMLIPFAVIVILLLMDHSVMYTGFWATVSLILATFIRKGTRPSLKTLIDGFVSGAKGGADIGIISAVIGLLLTTVNMTGIGLKLGAGIETWSGGSTVISLIIIWALAVIMGMIGVATVAYIVVSMFVISGLQKVGIPYETAHFFIFWPVCFGGITPPVAMFAIVAAKLAKASYIRTAIETCKMGGFGLLLPFMFVYNPDLLLEFRGPLEAVTSVAAGVMLVISAQVFFIGFIMAPVPIVLRLLFALVAVSSWAFLPTMNYLLFVGTLIAFVLLLMVQRKRSVSLKTSILITEG